MVDRAVALPLLLLVASLLLAGCAQQAPSAGLDAPAPEADATGADAPAAPTPPGVDIPDAPLDEEDEALTAERGQQLLDEAVLRMPDRLGVEMRMAREGEEMLALRGFNDNASGVTWFRFSADARMFGSEGAEDMAAVEELFRQGMEIYVGPEGGLYLVNGTALDFPPEAEPSQGLLPPPQESPFMDLFDLMRLGEGDGDEENDVRVDRMAPVTHRGRAAIRVDLANDTTTGSAILYTSPPRLAHVSLTMADGNELDGALLTMDFLYDAEVPSAGPPAVLRALGLAYRSDFDFTEAMWADEEEAAFTNTTWTFLADGGIPLDEVEVQVKAPLADGMGLADLPTLWSMRLSEGQRAEANVTLVFTDADGDGLVSKGDTLHATLPAGGEAPFLALRDLETGTYVVPGPAPLLALALAGAAALAWRRRA